MLDNINLIQASEWNKDNIYILDTETTGLYDDEVLSLSIVDYNSNILFDHLIKPAHKIEWREAQLIHHISPSDVENEKLLTDYWDKLKPIFMNEENLIVGYNVVFDVGMLENSGVEITCDLFDVMDTYSQVYSKKWHDRNYGEKKWCKLISCANHYNYGEFEAHGSLADTLATAHCFRCLLEDKQANDFWREWFAYLPEETTQERDERFHLQQQEFFKKMEEEDNMTF